MFNTGYYHFSTPEKLQAAFKVLKDHGYQGKAPSAKACYMSTCYTGVVNTSVKADYIFPGGDFKEV